MVIRLLLTFTCMFGILMNLFSQTLEPPPGWTPPEGLPSVYAFRLPTIEGREIDFDSLRGKKLLFVNVASECGYTYQYEGLQQLQTQYGDRVQVLAFPSNQFGKQEPGTDDKILAFCRDRYQVTFPVFGKTEVKGPGRCTVYQWLTDPSKNGWNDQQPAWNFNKYLVDETGRLVAWFSSKVKPMDEAILSRIRGATTR